MGADALAARLVAVLEPLAGGHDLVVEGVDVLTRGRLRTVKVVLDLADGPGSLGSDLLGDVTREISTALDEGDLVEGAYTLEVSSPGTSRPLTTPRHFRRAERRLVRFTLADGGERLGRVRSADDDGVTVASPEPAAPVENDVTLTYPQITKAVVEVELRRLEES
ncbi:ribosome maturation factor RimP [Serinibacter arcticus]|uniref:Ribosome maturation factor RimP n=1 Tax=Serinibacter arcticus TaxID=1655435 RepID=A0A2U1ZT10_9MICO|nr:ribosome maturation factor RimP [Serinibacter arcticus]PWD50073.1 ribosome maturation factor RimP [Serinibacter arcticus]